MVVRGPRSVYGPRWLSSTREVSWMWGCSPSTLRRPSEDGTGAMVICALPFLGFLPGGEGRRRGRLGEAEHQTAGPDDLLDAGQAGLAGPSQDQIGREPRLDGAAIGQADGAGRVEGQHPDGGRQILQALFDQAEGGRQQR